MTWTVHFLNAAVEREIKALPDDLQAKFLHIAEMLEEFGVNQVREPYVKPLIGTSPKLWEMRMKGKSGIARAVYVVAVGQRIVVVHAFIKKSDKTPRQAIETALKRAKEVL